MSKRDGGKPIRNRDEAVAVLGEIGALDRRLAMIETACGEAMARARSAAGAEGQPLADQRAILLHRLEIWCTANRDDLTDGGKRKSARLASGDVGWRKGADAIDLPADPDGMASLIAVLKAKRLGRFLRERVEVDKQALLKDRAAAGRVPGIVIREGTESFFAKPVIPFGP